MIGRLSFSYVFALLLLVSACDSGGGSDTVSPGECIIPVNEIVNGGVGKDGIPALENPVLVEAGSPGAGYLQPGSRIIGVLVDGEPIAVPHNILWFHEIVNLDGVDDQIAVSYCPLTGSSITFDRKPHGGATFGVSGLLWRNNLIMYDRNTNESLWPQMLRRGSCGEETGTILAQAAASEMTWEGWQRLYPNTLVVSSATGHIRNYVDQAYPYGNYEEPNNAGTLFPQFVNDDRPPKERVLGIPIGSGGKLYPFFELDTPELATAVNDTVDGRPVIVFWEDDSAGAVAYEAALNGEVLTFSVSGARFVDDQTESTWDLQGRAVAGELAGAQLLPVAEAYVAFWFAWKAFHPDAEVWVAP